MFSSREGQNLYKRILSTAEKHNMSARLSEGLLVGFSGGADSVMLLSFLCYYRSQKDLPSPCAVHVNHGIRGEEADSDAAFSQGFCRAIGVLCELVVLDVPAIASKMSIGIEQAAREARYSVFDEIIKGRNDINSIALAHNATDNVETVILNMLRGSGVKGMCGIPPVRDNIIRPLIEISKGEIEELLNRFDIPFVVDKTNFDTTLSRNFVRHNVLPLLRERCTSPEQMVGRMTDNLRQAASFIGLHADAVLDTIDNTSIFSAVKLRELHPAVFGEVFSRLVRHCTGITPAEKHINAAYSMIDNDDFSLSVGSGFDFVSRRGVCTFLDNNNSLSDIRVDLLPGKNVIDGTNLTVFIDNGSKCEKTYSNIYKKVIFKTFSRDIIDNGLYLRFRRDGDCYKYGGITHKLKKVFNDREIPSFIRGRIPIICDNLGILWVPGLSARDGAGMPEDDAVTISVCFAEDGGYTCYDASLFTDKI